MNHRQFDVPGYNEFTPITLYPGMLPEDFHLRVTPEGFFRKWDNTRDWGSVWQVQNLGLADLIDIAHEDPNTNFGFNEGDDNPKLFFFRQPNNPEYYDFHPTNGRVGFGNVTQTDLNNNPNFYKEDASGDLIRAVRWLVNETKCDGIRLDAVKHVPSYFFGQQSGAGKDESDAGYCGQIQLQFNLTHGFTDANHRNSNFDAEAVRDDALLFGEHLGEPPGFGEYIDAGMRLVDNPLRNYLNGVLGNPGSTLAGLDQRDFGGFSAPSRVMHAQSHDNDYATRRELQNALYFLKEGIANIYSDGYNKSQTCKDCGGAFPRHANAAYLGEFGDNKLPDLCHLHNHLARGGTRPRWSDADIVAFERYEYREGLSDPLNNVFATVVLFAINDNYGFPGDTSFDDGVLHEGAGTFYECFPVENSRGQGMVVAFPPGAVLYQLADTPGKERACSKLLVRKATNNLGEADATKNDANPVERKVYVGSQTLFPAGGAIEFKIPSGGYVMYAYMPPEANRSGVRDAVSFFQGGVEAPRMTIRRTDGRDGDTGFNPSYPFRMRGSIAPDGSVMIGSNVSNLTYAIDLPVITNNTPINIILRSDSSALNYLVKLDGGIDLNSHMNLGATNAVDKRDNRPGNTAGYPELGIKPAFDMFLGYEQAAEQFRAGPEKFAAENTARNQVASLGAETYHYTIGGGDARIDGAGSPNTTVNTATWVFHNPSGSVTTTNSSNPATQRNPLSPGDSVAADIWVKVTNENQINKCFVYYTTDGTNPEGSFGIGRGTTKVVAGAFQSDDVDLTVDWWKATIPSQSNGTTVKYKVALHKTGLAPVSDAESTKVYGVTQFAVTNLSLQTVKVRLHNNLNTNQTVTGLQEGFHIVRARPFLPRTGQSSVFNTFLQTFYYDPVPPAGAIAFPANNGDTLGSKQYGVVVRADPSTTEVEFNISDTDSANDDAVTGFPNGNGLSNGLPIFVKASEVSPLPSLNQTFPNFPQEFRFTYAAVPASGSATLTVRLKELTSATFSNRTTTLIRTVNCAAPPQFLEIAFPSFDGEQIFLDQNDKYTVVTRFTETLSAIATNFTIKIDGSVQARNAPDGTPLYVFNDQTPADGKNELRFDWGGMNNGQHLIEIIFNGDGLALQASRIVNVVLTGVSVNIINPPEADAEGRSPFVIYLPDKTNATPAERSFTVTTETSPTVTNVVISFAPPTNNFAGGVALLDTNFVGSTKRWDFG